MAFDMSKAAFGKPASNLDKVQKIPLGFIKSNEQNFYSIEGIDELADSIAMVGLLEPVRVVRISSSPTQPYQYKLISGHRRSGRSIDSAAGRRRAISSTRRSPPW